MESLKNKDSWCEILGDTKDHEYDTVSGVFWGQWYRWYLAQNSVASINGNRNVAYLNRNDSKRNLNLNWFDNDWNANYRFLAVRYYQSFSRDYFSGVLFAS